MKLKTRFQSLPPKLLRVVTGCLPGLFFLAIVLALLQARSHASTLVAAAPTNTPTSTPILTPTVTPTPTSVRPTPNPNIDKTVNGQQGPITVTQGDSVTYHWVVTNAGDRPFFATIDDDTHDALDGECPFVGFIGEPCEKAAVVTLLTPGLVTNTSRVLACGIPPWPDHCQAGYDEDSVTVNVVTPTPTQTHTLTPTSAPTITPTPTETLIPEIYLPLIAKYPTPAPTSTPTPLPAVNALYTISSNTTWPAGCVY